MNYFTVSTKTRKDNVFFFKLDLHLFHFPINVPRFHCIETPGLVVIACIYVHSHQTIERHSKKFLKLNLHKFIFEKKIQKQIFKKIV